MSGRHSSHEGSYDSSSHDGGFESSQHPGDEDLSHTAEMDAIPAQPEPGEPEAASEEPADLGEYSLTEPPEPKRRLLRTRYVVAGAVTVGTLAIATAGVAAVHSMTTAGPPNKVQIVTPSHTATPTPSATPPADLRQYAGDKASRSMGTRPSPTPSPSKSSSGSNDDNGGGGSGGSPVTTGGTCKASFYGEGQSTASGEPFDPSAMTAAHKTLKFGTMVKVTNVKNNKTVTVRINDRGPYVSGRCLDLTTAAFKRIASTSAGVATVRYQVVG
ncbi:septal ring lytic transglycosylase RlpA family protein [Fodinicola acaciae]|uniref:septal ring lytic transglycosylase RlpA family protein n=1 Tax=Fodinicola acaciae TaxID=2681555 RepID=UPI001C9E8120|nr:septal ring lytic transglycosylase RlpA family protein [Fodinicola acaciae]